MANRVGELAGRFVVAISAFRRRSRRDIGEVFVRILTGSTIESNLLRPLILTLSDHPVLPSRATVRFSQ